MTPYLIRQAAVVVADLLNFDGPADAKLSYFFRNNRDLGTKDRAFIAETAYAILRRLRYLSAASQENEGDEPDARKLVLAYLIKLQGMSVQKLSEELDEQQKEWAKAIKAKQLDKNDLALQADVPDWLWTKLVAQYGEADALAISRSMHTAASLDLRVNTLKGNREDTLKQLLAQNTSVKQIDPTPYAPTGIRMPLRLNISKHKLFTEGQIEVQDEGSQVLSYLVAPKRGMMVADVCAGGGGKTLAMGAMMKNTGRLYAFDVSEKRLSSLSKRLKRSGLSNMMIQRINNENDTKLKRLHGKFDRVLVDAPCSGMGTLRRNPDLKWRQQLTDIAELNDLQNRILNSAAKLVKAGGRLVYATCSLLQEENEAMVEKFLAEHPAFSLVRAADVLAQQKLDLDTGEYLKLLPNQHQTDGFFAAVLEKSTAK